VEIRTPTLNLVYLSRLPKTIPPGWRLVHNHVTRGITPHRRIGMFGFRVWLAGPGTSGLVPCVCGWEPNMGPHYRVARIPA